MADANINIYISITNLAYSIYANENFITMKNW